MKQDRLANLIEQPKVLRKILGDYEGGYSLGLTLNPQNRDQYAIRVRIEGDDSVDIPSQIVLDGEAIPVIVTTNFRIPEPLTRG